MTPPRSGAGPAAPPEAPPAPAQPAPAQPGGATVPAGLRRSGQGTLRFDSRPRLAAAAAVAGRLEGEGPLGPAFDAISRDSLCGQASWELAEAEMMRRAAHLALGKADRSAGDAEFLFGGDLLNQIAATNFAARDLDVPTIGLFSACATLTSALTLAGLALDGQYAACVLVGVSSHHDAAERQYRFPTELGRQRPPTAQWTATAAAAFVLERGDGGGRADPVITLATPGRVVDYGVKNPYDMGSAMAPAAADTIERHLRDTGRQPEDYDLIITGDLAAVGVELCDRLLRERGIEIQGRHEDCGLLLYDRARQDVHAGASGTACSGATFAAHFLPRLRSGELGRVLLVATGALLSPTTYQQGQSIPCVAHAVAVEGVG